MNQRIFWRLCTHANFASPSCLSPSIVTPALSGDSFKKTNPRELVSQLTETNMTGNLDWHGHILVAGILYWERLSRVILVRSFGSQN